VASRILYIATGQIVREEKGSRAGEALATPAAVNRPEKWVVIGQWGHGRGLTNFGSPVYLTAVMRE